MPVNDVTVEGVLRWEIYFLPKLPKGVRVPQAKKYNNVVYVMVKKIQKSGNSFLQFGHKTAPAL